VLYGVHSASNTTAKEFNVAGKGDIVGARYLLPLPGLEDYSHNLTAGVDYKKFDETTINFANDLIGSSASRSPITYLPFSIAYSASLADAGGVTQLSAAANFAFRGLLATEQSFQEKRYQARADYLFLTLGAERTQKLPGGFGCYLKLDGQIADAPLSSNEQFAAGGMESVRGYQESAVMGDEAIHGTLEVSAPNLAEPLELGDRFLISPYLFTDFASLWTKSPLPGQDAGAVIYGVGVGVRGYLFRSLEYQLDYGFALADNAQTVSGDGRFYFKLKYSF
jgi:hemolysin activation/secretion protein